jgi:small subunit ribosomal protein S27Ae
VAKARVGLYSVKGDQLTRTHKHCPKCGPGVFLAEHANRLSCGRCGYSESRAPSEKPAAAKVEKPKVAKGPSPPKAAPPKAPPPKAAPGS